MGGPDIPAVGFALGIERVMLVLKEPPEEKTVEIFVAIVSGSLIEEGWKILHLLRQKDISSDMDYCGKSLKGQLRYARKCGAKYVLILGEDEWKDNCVILRNMETSTQEKVKVNDLIVKIKNQESRVKSF